MREAAKTPVMLRDPLTEAQRRLWQIECIAGTKSKPNEVLCLQVADASKLDRLRAAVEAVLFANPVYRSTIDSDGRLVFWVRGAAGTPAAEVCEDPDCAGVAAGGPAGGLDDIYQAERLYDFDLEREPPVRMCVIRSTGRVHLLLTFHPIAMTKWGLDTVFEAIEDELECAVDADSRPRRSRAGAQAPMPHARAPSSLTNKLDLIREPQSFPTDRPRGGVKRFASSRHEFVIDERRCRALRELLADGGHGERSGLLALFCLVAARYLQQAEVRVGVARESMPNELAHDEIPMFDHSMVRVGLTGTLTFRGLSGLIEKELELAQSREHAAADPALDTPSLNQAMSFSPFCQLAFDYQSDGRQSDDRKNREISHSQVKRCYPPEPERSFSHSEIELEVRSAHSGALHCALEYSAALFEKTTIVELAGGLSTLLDHVLAHPDADIVELQSRSAAEPWSSTGHGNNRANYPSGPLDVLFCAQAARTPEAIALVDGDLHLSWREIDEASGRLAGQLHAIGVECGDRIGIFLPRSAEFVVSVLAVLRCGAVYVPLDMQMPAEWIGHIQADAGLKVVMHRQEDVDIPGWQHIEKWPRAAVASDSKVPDRPRRNSDAAYVIYTSGSTGRPKGVIGSHKGVVNRVWWARPAFQLDDDDVFCTQAGIGFIDHVAEVFQPLLTGGTLIIVADDVLANTTAFVSRLSDQRVTRLTLVPCKLSALLDTPIISRLRTLRSVVCSGDTLPSGLARRFFRAFSRTRLFNVYGLTETGADNSVHEVTRDPAVDLRQFFMETCAASSGGGRQITAQIAVDELKNRFVDSELPKEAVGVEEYSSWLDREVLPFAVNVSSAKFIGHMTSALPDFMVQLSGLVSKLNQNMVKMETSKSLTLLERQLIAMLHREFFARDDYDHRIQNPQDVFGLVVSGGSSANITALWNARNRAMMSLGYGRAEIDEFGPHELLRRRGYDGFAVITSRLAHYSIRKAVSLLGMGERNLLFLKQDANQRADLEDLKRQIDSSRERRLLVIAIIGIAGATETGTIDPLAGMASVAAAHRIHFHVDAAWGGAMIFSDRYRNLLDGIELADTITLCPHKQLFVPQGISLCLFRDPRHVHASSTAATYQARPGSFDLGRYTMEGSRPAQFLFLHAMLHVVSKRGIGALVELGIDNTRYLAKVIAGLDAFELVGGPQTNILNYRYIPRSLRGRRRFSLEENRRISQAVAAIQERQFLLGKTFVSKTDLVVDGLCTERITVFRVVIANPLTTHQDLLDTLRDQLEIANAIVEELPAAGVSCETIADLVDGSLKSERHSIVSIGRPIANTEILILDAARRPLPAGVVGEICVGGDGLSIGYVDRDDGTDVFVPHPFKAGDKLFRTGDFGRQRADGNIELLGRRDRQIKICGMRVELAQIEAALGRCDDVKECAVVAGTEAGEATSTAFVVPLSADARTKLSREKALRRQLVECIPAYMVPSTFHFVDSLPMTPGGKVDLRTLETAHPRPQRLERYPESPIESRLRAIWERVLERPGINVTDNFFDVGGRSLTIGSLQKQIKREFAIDLSLKSLFEHPRLEDLAGVIEREQFEEI